MSLEMVVKVTPLARIDFENFVSGNKEWWDSEEEELVSRGLDFGAIPATEFVERYFELEFKEPQHRVSRQLSKEEGERTGRVGKVEVEPGNLLLYEGALRRWIAEERAEKQHEGLRINE
jgi:hypothetical protein